jgi:hypothetical protein
VSGNRISGSGFSFQVQGSYHWYTGDLSRSLPSHEDRLTQSYVRYDHDPLRVGMQVGRFGVLGAGSFGTIDGILSDLSFSPSARVGAFVGSAAQLGPVTRQSKESLWGINGELRWNMLGRQQGTALAYWNVSEGSQGGDHLASRLDLQWHKALRLNSQIEFEKALSDSPWNLRQLSLNLRGRLERRVTFSAGYSSYRETLITVTTIDSVIERTTRNGYRAGLDLFSGSAIGVGLNGTYDDGGFSKSVSRSARGSLSWRPDATWQLYGSAQFSRNTHADIWFPSLSITRSFSKSRVQTELGWTGSYSRSRDANPDSNSNYLRARISKSVANGLYVSAADEYQLGDNGVAQTLLGTLSYRF